MRGRPAGGLFSPSRASARSADSRTIRSTAGAAATSAARACAPLVVMHSAAVRCHDSVSEAVSRRRALAVNGSAYHDGGRGGAGAEGGEEGKREVQEEGTTNYSKSSEIMQLLSHSK